MVDYACESKRTLIQLLIINKPLFGAVAGDQVIKNQSSIAFVSIFSFSLDFSFASLNFDHPKKTI
jgi:hypothetical protein